MYYNGSNSIHKAGLAGVLSSAAKDIFNGVIGRQVGSEAAVAPAKSTGQESRVPVSLTDCPVSCHDETSYEDWFITDQPCEGCLPFALDEKTIECDAPDANQKADYQPDCNDFKNALRSMGIDLSDSSEISTPDQTRGIYGLKGLSSCGCGNQTKSLTGASCGLRGLSNAKGDTAGGDVDLSETGYYDGSYNGGTGSKAKDAMMATGFLNLPMWLWLLLGGVGLGYAASRYLMSKGD